MRFVPAHKQSDEATNDLSPAKFPVELFLITNEKEREAFLSHSRIQSILFPAIHATCRLTHAQTDFSLTTLSTWNGTGQRTATHPVRLIPILTATLAQATPVGPVTHPGDASPKPTPGYNPLSAHHTIHPPNQPPQKCRTMRRLATGLEAFLKAGYTASSYTWADTDPDAHTAVYIRSSSHRGAHMVGTRGLSPRSSSPMPSQREWTSYSRVF